MSKSKAPKNEEFTFNTANGKVTVSRSADIARIESVRTCYGFRETEVKVVQRLDSSCVHFAFFPKNDLIENLKSQ